MYASPPFIAEITAKTFSGGLWRYSWKEQMPQVNTFAYTDADQARQGTATVSTAFELNNEEVDTGVLVVMYCRGFFGGHTVYEFVNPAGGGAGGGGLSWMKLTVTHSELHINGFTNNVSIYTLPAKSLIHCCVMHHTEAFDRSPPVGGVYGYAVSVGITGNSAYVSGAPLTVSTTTSDTYYYVNRIDGSWNYRTALSLHMGATTDIRLFASSSSSYKLNETVQGSVDVYLLISNLDGTGGGGGGSLGDGDVTTNLLADGAVTNAKLGAAAVSMDKLAGDVLAFIAAMG